MAHAHHESHEGHDHSANWESMDAVQQFAFRWGIILNLGYCLIEGGIGWATDSMALLADAVHNLTDVLGLVLGWAAFAAARRRGRGRFTYGFKRGTVLAAFTNGLLLLGSCLFLAWESIERFFHPEPVHGLPMALAAGAGILVNAYTAWLFTKTSRSDINARGAFIHLAADAAVSLGVVISGLLIMQTGATWIDPVAGLLIVGVILKSTWGLLVESVFQLFDGVPAHVSIEDVKGYLKGLPGVESLHDLHVWNLSTSLTACSAHLGVAEGVDRDALLVKAHQGLQSQFGIRHSTIQLEGKACAQECG